MDNKQAILGFTEFFKGITGNQNLEIPSEIAEKIGLQAQEDGDIITALCSLPKIISEDGQDYVQLADVLETVRRYKPSVAVPTKTGHWIKYQEPWGGMQGWKCSNCKNHYDVSRVYTIIPYNYCPNCGRHMVEPQESEG